MKNTMLRLIAIAAIATAACSGDKGDPGANGTNGTNGTDGATGPAGPQGPAGADGQDVTAKLSPEACGGCHTGAGPQHQALYNSFADGINPASTKLAAQIVSVTTSAGTNANSFKSTVTFTLTKGGQPFTDGASALKQKTMYFVSYDGAGKFTTAPYKQDAATDPTGSKGGQDATSPVNFSYGSMTATATPGTYTMIKDNLSADPLTANANAFVYGYFGDTVLDIPVKPTTHYTLMDNVVSVAKVVAGTVGYTSTANVSACENCHGKPYSKHGYRQATVAGLNDFVSCKACHTDQRRGTDAAWYLLTDDPAAYAAQDGVPTDEQNAKYAYTANVMNDTHNSHAFEFAYPQSMSNCATCHAGKLDRIQSFDSFNLKTCKSCHPVTGVGGTDPKRAPALESIMPASIHTFMANGGLYTFEGACNTCHRTEFGLPTLKDIHPGYNTVIYADGAGTKYSSVITAKIDSVKYDAATKKVTVNFSATGSAAGHAAADIKPTVVMSLYGYDTKDFLVSGHGSAADGKRNLESAFGGTQSPRLTITAGATAGTWVAVADLTNWAAQLADGSVKTAEVAVIPTLALDTTKPVQADKEKANYNPALALNAVTATVAVTATNNNAIVANAYGKKIVDPAKCNACHDALGTTFHTADRGGSVVTCRVCHTVQSGGSHLEMQSRSIDSYVHAIHSFQAFDIKAVNFADPVAALEYEEHINSTYPNFTILNCESCHNAGTYDVPDQQKSMPSVLSASSTLTGTTRAINGIPSVVTGPGSRACGACHRAEKINEDNADGLEMLNEHVTKYGYFTAYTTGLFESVSKKMAAFFQ